MIPETKNSKYKVYIHTTTPPNEYQMPHWGHGGQGHWAHKLVMKLPFKKSPNLQAFTASIILIGVLCTPKYLTSKDAKPGHGIFDQEQPEEIQLQRAEARREAARQRSLAEWQKIKEEGNN